MFQIDKEKKRFLNHGEPTIYLADTCWSAFTNTTLEDWTYYLDYRQKQGFNVIQVNLLRQWDASQSALNWDPFLVQADGSYDFSHYNEAYFQRVEQFFQVAESKGMTLALVLFWVNYLPGTWASQMPLKQLGIFPKEMVTSYVDKVMENYDKYAPIYLVSGDTDFPNDSVILDYYQTALNRIKGNNPKAVTSLHIRGREADLPQVLKANPNLDFYMYQSGHNVLFPDCHMQLGESFSQFDPQKPVVNAEPCYEQMGYARKMYGRFSREDVRRVAWQSVLSGSAGGITYGAHGIWSWHNSQLGFDTSIGEAFETPFDWHQALTFKGAEDYSFLKKFLEEEGLFDLVADQDLLNHKTQEIRLARSKAQGVTLVYLPVTIQLKLKGHWEALPMVYIDLESKKRQAVEASYDAKKDESLVPMHSFERDAILVIREVRK